MLARLLILTALLPTLAFAGEVRDERRFWSDGSVQEVWTYDGAIDEDKLLRKELFHENGVRQSLEEFRGGVQHGAVKTWFDHKQVETEGTFADGGAEGVWKRWERLTDYERTEKKKRPVLEEEKHYLGGQLHGKVFAYAGPDKERWARVEQDWVNGELHGLDLERRDAKGMARKHSYDAGVLHGRQLAWHYDGAMQYQYNFVQGVPDGPQRLWESHNAEEPLQELFWRDGGLHGHQKFEWIDGGVLEQDWVSGLRSDEDLDDDGSGRITRLRYEPTLPWVLDNGEIKFRGDVHEVDRFRFGEGGVLTSVEVLGDERWTIHFHPNGSVSHLGRGGGGRQNGPWRYLFDDGGLWKVALHNDDGQKEGEWRIYDREGRLRELQTWDYYRTGWFVVLYDPDGVKYAEGDIHPAAGARPMVMGSWKYFDADGRTVRTENYGSGPYSGNRHFVSDATEYDAIDRVRFFGTEKELTYFDYLDDTEQVKRKRKLTCLDRSRHGLDFYDPETMTVDRLPIDKPKELADGALLIEDVLGSRALVLEDKKFRDDGSLKQVERFDRNGARAGLQEGWYRDGQQAYAYEYKRGTFATAREWWKGGSPRLEARLDDGQIYSVAFIEPEGRRHEWSRSDDRPFRVPAELVKAAVLFKFDDRVIIPN
ncbi:MAG: hypothetical protein GY898_13245 [Proteobacteria bacterium]|nr:hypothetical protein [Pseudomonadota bacterium]